MTPEIFLLPRDSDAATGESGESAKAEFASSRAGQVKFRIDEDQMQYVQKKATDQHTTISATVRWLLSRGIEADKQGISSDAAVDMAVVWARFSERFMALALEDDLLKAVEEDRYEDAKAYAVALRKYHAKQARKQIEKPSS